MNANSRIRSRSSAVVVVLKRERKYFETTKFTVSESDDGLRFVFFDFELIDRRVYNFSFWKKEQYSFIELVMHR